MLTAEPSGTLLESNQVLFGVGGRLQLLSTDVVVVVYVASFVLMPHQFM